MAIAYRGAGAVSFGIGALTPALPTGHTTDDLMILAVETSAQTPPATWPPTGWTERTDSPVAFPSVNAGAAAPNTQLHVLYKVHDGSESAPTVPDSGNHQVAVVIAYTGVSTSDPWGDDTNSGSSDTGSSTITMGGVTTDVANAMVVHIATVAEGDEATEGQAVASSWTNANLTSLTERVDYVTIVGNDGGILIADGFKASAGASGNTTATLAHDKERTWWTGSLNPAGGSSPVTVTPTTASLTTTRFAPTIAHKIIVPVKALTTTRFAPTIGHKIIVPVKALTTTGFAPAINIGVNVVPTTKALTLTTFAPTVSATQHVRVVPTTLALTVTRFAPVIGHKVIVPVKALTLATFAPTIRLHKIVTPGTAALTTTRFAPTIGHKIVVPTKALTMAAFAPVVKHGIIVPTAALTITRYAPTIGHKIIVPTRALTTATFAPVIGLTLRAVPSTLGLSVTG